MNWLERLLDHKTPIKKSARRSRHWDTCAVGEAQQNMPLIVKLADDGRPRDASLNALGRYFHEAIRKNQWRRALRTYFRIQQRIIRLAR